MEWCLRQGVHSQPPTLAENSTCSVASIELKQIGALLLPFCSFSLMFTASPLSCWLISCAVAHCLLTLTPFPLKTWLIFGAQNHCRVESGVGMGMMSDMQRVVLTWSEPSTATHEGLPSTLIAKLTPTNPTVRNRLRTFTNTIDPLYIDPPP